MMIFTGLDHLFTHQKLISVFIDEHLMLDRWYLILLRLDISDLCLVVQLLNLRLLRLLLNQQVISNLSNLNLSLWIILNLQMNFLNFIRMGFQFVASLFHEAPVLICFIKLKIFRENTTDVSFLLNKIHLQSVQHSELFNLVLTDRNFVWKLNLGWSPFWLKIAGSIACFIFGRHHPLMSNSKRTFKLLV